MRSPIVALEGAIARAAFRIAPESENDLAQWADVEKFTLVLSDDPKFNIRVNTKTHEATLPIAALEYLWCSAYAFLIFYDEYTKAQRAGELRFNMAASPQAVGALNLLNWSLRNMQTTGKQPWLNGAPAPQQFPQADSVIRLANELFLCAIAWIIHHEIAHIRFGHTRAHYSYTIQQEREADTQATSWILSKSKVEQESTKRTLGIATAILAMQLLELPGADASERTHPRAVERLHYCLEKAGVSDDSKVCSFAAVVLQIHLAQYGIVAKLEGVSFRDILSELMVSFISDAR